MKCIFLLVIALSAANMHASSKWEEAFGYISDVGLGISGLGISMISLDSKKRQTRPPCLDCRIRGARVIENNKLTLLQMEMHSRWL